MKCRHCGEQYSASYNQNAPGGSNAPGVFFFAALLFLPVAALFLLLNLRLPFIIAGGAGVLCLLAVPLAWWDCRARAGSQDGGNWCPFCHRHNRMWPWSL